MTPRLRKERFCRPFHGDRFYKPRAVPLAALEIILLGQDEIEAMCLCDHEGLEQGAAAEKMKVSRGTVQRLLYSGRKKVIEAITQSKALQIEGGEHILPPGRFGCQKRHRGGE